MIHRESGPHPCGLNLVEVLRDRAHERPAADAFTFLRDGEAEEVRWNYAELDLRARSIAAHLQGIGAAGQRVLLLYPPGLDFIAGFFGCLYAGAVAVPTYPNRPRRPLSRLLNIVRDTDAVASLTTAAKLEEMETSIAAEPTLRELRWLASDRIDATSAGGWQPPAIDPESLAYLQYTSGSTGMPKGVMISHANVIANQRMITEGFEHTQRLVGFGWLPLYHDMGLIGIVLQAAYLGRPSILMSPASFLQQPLRWLWGISRYRATTSGGPSFAYAMCVREAASADLTGLDLSCWDIAFNGAEPVRADVLERFSETFAPYGFRRESFYPCYGMAEATLIVTGGAKHAAPRFHRVAAAPLAVHRVDPCAADAADGQTLVGCGRPLGGADLRIVDPQTHRPCEPGRVGEIWVAGPHVAQGYWRDADATARTFDARLARGDGKRYLRTGDLGFLDAGELFVTGRLKDVIIVRGRNHYPQDIERTVADCHPALEGGRGAAFSVERNGEERLVVVQEVRRSHLRELDAAGVLDLVRQAVAEQHDLEVDAVLLLRTASLPTTTSGKVRRRACRERFLGGELQVVARWPQPSAPTRERRAAPPPAGVRSPADAPTTAAVEGWLVDRLAGHLRVPPEQIDVRQPFARYGLDSVATVRLADELGRWLGRSLDPVLAYQYPTIELLSRHLMAPPTAEPSKLAPTVPPDARHEPIAIVGMGCRFPGADNLASFWQLLRSGAVAVGQMPDERRHLAGGRPDPWRGVRHSEGGYLAGIDQFDARFFSIAPREVVTMDPQQRLLLEVSWQALEDAAIPPDQLAGSQTGVFIGISTGDYSRLHIARASGVSAYAGTGHALSIAANRLSYVLDLHGPSWAVDTGCSSSLVAVHQACRSLRGGECDLAIAAGVNLILLPQLTEVFTRAGMLADQGRCRTFSADADGYVRSEGCGVVVLKRLSAALQDGDRIAALILGTAVNQDGRSNGLTAPNGPAQEAVIRRAQQDAGIRPDDVGYVEAHGTGTPLGDPIEFASLRNVLRNGQPREHTCWVGSVKTNIGHTEAAAGVAGLIKAVLALEHDEIPPHLHFTRLNPKIDAAGSQLVIPTHRTAWPRGSRRRLAGINSFGFGGTNAHVIIGDTPPVPRHRGIDRPVELLAVSAKCEPALVELVRRFDRHLERHPDLSLGDVCHTANAGRAHFTHRLAILAGSTAELRQKLQALVAGQTLAGTWQRVTGNTRVPKTAFVFSAVDSLPDPIDPTLLLDEPALKDVLDECDEAFHEATGRSFSGLLREVPRPWAAGDPRVPQRAFEVAWGYAWAELWRAWGVAADILAGVGPGELTAACLAGVFDLGAALRLAAAGAAALDDGSPRSLEIYRERCAATAYREPMVRLVTGGTAALPELSQATATYWIEQLHRPASGKTCAAALRDAGCDLVLELVAGSGSRPLPHRSQPQLPIESDAEGNRWLSWPARRHCGWQEALALLAELYTRGIAIDWQAVDRRFAPAKVTLPGYPFQRKRYWLDMAEGEAAAAGAERDLASLGSLLGSPTLLGATPAAVEPPTADAPRFDPIGPDEVEARVSADAGDGGFAGTITRVGDAVTLRRPGDAVVGIAARVADQRVRTSAHLVAARPPDLSDADAASLPVAFLAASIALEQVARIRVGDRLLIHAADRRQADAVARLAGHLGAELILVTDAIRQPDDSDCPGLINLDAASPNLASELRAACAGEALDLVVTCSAGTFDQAIVSWLRPSGHLIVIGAGTTDALTPCSAGHSDVWVSVIDPGEAIAHEPGLVRHILARIDAVWAAAEWEDRRASEPRGAAADAEFVRHWHQAAPEHREALLDGYLQRELAGLLGLDEDRIDRNEPLTYLGIDSLMALDLRNRVRSATGLSVPASALIEGTTLANLTDQLVRQWTDSIAQTVSEHETGDAQEWVEGAI
jgi:acyl transferase domain-containing protein/acyl-CoA synthetase (AMP-forming)/AMP-acid ligase II/acyl carrier protein